MRKQPAPFSIPNSKIKMATTLTLKPGNTPPAADAAPQTLEGVLAQLEAANALALQHDEANKSLIEQLAAAKAAPAEEPAKAQESPSQYAALMGKRTWLKTVHGDMTNLHTGEVFAADPKKATVDQFILNQLDAGKMAVHVETDD